MKIQTLFLLSLITLLLLLVACAPTNVQTNEKTLTSVTPEEFQELITQNPDAILIDVRTPEEYAAQHLEGATNIDFYASSFTSDLNALDKDATYLIYCRSGSRSGETLRKMESLGFTSVYNLQSGIIAWNMNQLPTVTS